MSKTPTISIVVTIVDGGPYLRDFLGAVEAMHDAPSIEIIVPFDSSVGDTALLRDQFPHVNFLPMGEIVPIRPIQSQGGQHELYDRRRARGLSVASGQIVAILEDRGHPSLDWASTLVRLHTTMRNNVIGGAIECAEPVSLLHWAFYVTDFGRYGRPFESGASTWVSDVNVSYKQAALAQTRHLWSDRFHEIIVHDFLISKGEELHLSNSLVVNHRRPPITLGRLLRERVEWGILYGYLRTKQTSTLKRAGLILASPLIAPLLWVRHGVVQTKKGRGLRYLKALPYVIILTLAWTVGEVWGYITRRP